MGGSSTPRRDMEWDCLDERLDEVVLSRLVPCRCS